MVWYFAYGSNMESATLRGRRGIRYDRALPGHAPGWRLVLDKPGLFPTGTSFANIIPDAAAEVWPADYVAFLRGIPARPESAEIAQLRPFIDEALRRR